MKKLIIVIVTLAALPGFSQVYNIGFSQKAYAGLTYSPDYCYRVLKPDNSILSQEIINYRDSVELPKMGYTTGLSFLFKLHKRLAIETGIQFTNKREKSKKIDLISANNSVIGNHHSPGNHSPVLMDQVSYEYSYQYLNIPIKFNCYFKKRPNIFISTGVSTNVFYQEKSITNFEFADGTTQSTNASNSNSLPLIHLTGLVGFGVEYSISDWFLFRLEPIYRRSITPIDQNPVKQSFYSFGANVGVFFKL